MLAINAAAAVLVFVFTTVLTIAGVGSAFIVIPTFYWLGVPLTEAMAIGLLLNAISMTFASANYIRYNLVLFRTAIPIIVLAVRFFSPGRIFDAVLPEKCSHSAVRALSGLRGIDDAFLQAEEENGGSGGQQERNSRPASVSVSARGTSAGFWAWAAETSLFRLLSGSASIQKKRRLPRPFIVVFASLSGFFGHAAMGSINWNLLTFAAVGSIAGAILGSWLMHKKLDANQVKKIIGIVLYVIAAKMAWGLLKRGQS